MKLLKYTPLIILKQTIIMKLCKIENYLSIRKKIVNKLTVNIFFLIKINLLNISTIIVKRNIFYLQYTSNKHLSIYILIVGLVHDCSQKVWRFFFTNLHKCLCKDHCRQSGVFLHWLSYLQPLMTGPFDLT